MNNMFDLRFLNHFCTNSLLVILFSILIAITGISLALMNYVLLTTKDIVSNNEELIHEIVTVIGLHENKTGEFSRIVPLQNYELLQFLRSNFNETFIQGIYDDRAQTNQTLRLLTDNFGAETNYIDRENQQYDQANKTFAYLNQSVNEIKETLANLTIVQ